MSFYFRDKPKFGDKFRGKSGDKLLEEIQQQLDEDRKSFFEPSSRSSRFPFDRRTNFPKQEGTYSIKLLGGAHPQRAGASLKILRPRWKRGNVLDDESARSLKIVAIDSLSPFHSECTSIQNNPWNRGVTLGDRSN